MKRFYLLLLLCTAISLCTSAQIGYQVSLLNNATGEPRSNERVTITVKITNSKGDTVCEETKNETSNDFGVVSMCVGNSETFSNADWSKLPFFIEATVDGRMIGKSQLLSVPVAEYAKRTGTLTVDLLCSKEWECMDDILKFKSDKTYILHFSDDEDEESGTYSIDGNIIILINGKNYGDVYHYNTENSFIISPSGYLYR